MKSHMKLSAGPSLPLAVVILGWAAVKELNLSYHNPETILFTIYPYNSNLN